MKPNLPNSYIWFSKLNLLRFIPWEIDSDISIDKKSFADERFQIECEGREVRTFASRQDQDTFAGFEIIDGNFTEKVLVFHPSFQKNVEGWNIIQNEYLDFFDFLKLEVLPEMKEWIETDDIEDYIN